MPISNDVQLQYGHDRMKGPDGSSDVVASSLGGSMEVTVIEEVHIGQL